MGRPSLRLGQQERPGGPEDQGRDAAGRRDVEKTPPLMATEPRF
jgi:hypothetical protein